MLRQAGDERNREGERLAAAGLAAAQDVAPGQGVGQRRGLDREGDVRPAAVTPAPGNRREGRRRYLR